MRGRIALDSDGVSGATFTITLPVQLGQELARREPEPPLAEPPQKWGRDNWCWWWRITRPIN